VETRFVLVVGLGAALVVAAAPAHADDRASPHGPSGKEVPVDRDDFAAWTRLSTEGLVSAQAMAAQGMAPGPLRPEPSLPAPMPPLSAAPTGEPYEFHPVHSDRIAAYVHVESGVDWFFRLPSLATDGIHTPTRTTGGGVLPNGRDVPMLRAGADVGLSYGNTLFFPMLGLDVAGAAFGAPRVKTSLDGTVVDVRPGGAFTVGISLPGFGVRTKVGRWQVAGSARPEVLLANEPVELASGADALSVSLVSMSIGGHAEVEVCRRFDSVERACLFAGARAFDYAPLAAVYGGLRWELGR
jgi:hypothetical protein